jgi:hypothetical protein
MNDLTRVEERDGISDLLRSAGPLEPARRCEATSAVLHRRRHANNKGYTAPVGGPPARVLNVGGDLHLHRV